MPHDLMGYPNKPARPQAFREPVQENASLREASRFPGLKETILRGEELGDKEMCLRQCENAVTGLFRSGLQVCIDAFGAEAVLSALETSPGSDTLVGILRKLEPDPEKRRDFFADMPIRAKEQLESRPRRPPNDPDEHAWLQGRAPAPTTHEDARPAAERLVTEGYANGLGMIADACLRIERRGTADAFDRALTGTDFLPYFQSIARSNPDLLGRLQALDGNLLEVIDDLRADIEALRRERKLSMHAAGEYVAERLKQLLDARDAKAAPIDARQRRIERELKESPELRPEYAGVLDDIARSRERLQADDRQIERWVKLFRYVQRIERS